MKPQPPENIPGIPKNIIAAAKIRSRTPMTNFHPSQKMSIRTLGTTPHSRTINLICTTRWHSRIQ
jgi:hypothetical protein